jgi:hypothetical protein
MKNTVKRNLGTTFPVLLVLLVGAVFTIRAPAQNQGVQERVTDIKQAAAKNKQALAQYTWLEQVTISLKGEEKKQEHFQVRMGPDGKPLKTSLDPPTEASAPEGGRLKRHVVEKKKEEYKEYADRMKTLAQQYVSPDKDLLQQAYAQGNVTLGPTAGAPNELQLVIHNYVKPQDSMTLVFDKAEKQLRQIRIASYMDDPKDALNMTVQFIPLPDGTNHVSNLMMDGVSKHMNVAIQNSNYRHL